MSAPEGSRPVALAPTPRLRRLGLVALVAVAAAIITAHGELLVLAAPAIVLLALTPADRTVPLSATAALSTDRCVEGDEVELVLRVRVSEIHRGTLVDAVQADPGQLRWTDVSWRSTVVTPDGWVESTWALVPRRWGRHRIGPLLLRVHTGGGAGLGRSSVEVGSLVVHPAAAAFARAVAPRELAAPLGSHPSRAAGSGVELIGVRPYAGGDRERDVDWRATARLGGLMVRQYAAERAFDLVLVLDTAVDAGEPGRSSLDLTVRAATGLTQIYLRAHDRVGLVTFGGPLHWIVPGTGPRQVHRLAEALLSLRRDQADLDAGVEHDLGRLPRGLLPHRAFVAVLSPLLDAGAVTAVERLHERGFAPLVIDVLVASPAVPARSRESALALRVWRMERAATKVELAGLGVPVLSWDGEGDLTGGLISAMRGTRARPRRA